jgi:CRP-like cAMP-binding protein
MLRTPKSEYLQMHDLFRDLCHEDIVDIERQTTMTTCHKGKIFYVPQDTGEVLFLLKEGAVQIYRLSRDGKKLVLARLEAGAVFGEMALVGQGMQHAFAEALTDCTLCMMNRQDIEQLILQRPGVALRFIEWMGRRLRDTERRLEEVTFKSIPERLAGLLLRLATNDDSRIVGYTHQELGEMLGTYRETTTQTLNEFKAQGMIEIGRKLIEIKDRDALHQVAEM